MRDNVGQTLSSVNPAISTILSQLLTVVAPNGAGPRGRPVSKRRFDTLANLCNGRLSFRPNFGCAGVSPTCAVGLDGRAVMRPEVSRLAGYALSDSHVAANQARRPNARPMS